MKDKIIQENLSMTGILKWLEENHKTKKSGKAFSVQDVQGYIARGNIPTYLGGHTIVKIENKYNKLYKLVENNEVQ